MYLFILNRYNWDIEFSWDVKARKNFIDAGGSGRAPPWLFDAEAAAFGTRDALSMRGKPTCCNI